MKIKKIKLRKLANWDFVKITETLFCFCRQTGCNQKHILMF